MNIEWTEWAVHQVTEMALHDRDYRELCLLRNEQETVYISIMEKLSPEEKEQVEDYIASCENLEYMMSIMAYEFGKQVGRAQSKVTIR